MSSTTPVPHPHPDSSSPKKDSPYTSIGSEARNPARGKRIIRTGDDVSNYLVSDRDDKDACFTLRSITLGLIGATFQAVLTQIYRVQTDRSDDQWHLPCDCNLRCWCGMGKAAADSIWACSSIWGSPAGLVAGHGALDQPCSLWAEGTCDC